MPSFRKRRLCTLRGNLRVTAPRLAPLGRGSRSGREGEGKPCVSVRGRQRERVLFSHPDVEEDVVGDCSDSAGVAVEDEEKGASHDVSPVSLFQ